MPVSSASSWPWSSTRERFATKRSGGCEAWACSSDSAGRVRPPRLSPGSTRRGGSPPGARRRPARSSGPAPEALAGLGPAERVTAWGQTVDGDVLVATPRGLWIRGIEGMARLGWHEIHKARWDAGQLTLVPAVEVEPGVREDAPPLSFRLS